MDSLHDESEQLSNIIGKSIVTAKSNQQNKLQLTQHLALSTQHSKLKGQNR